MSLSVGLVGAGLAGRSHALDVVTDPGMQLVGVVSGTGRSGHSLADTFACVAYPDMRTMVEVERVDALVVAVPPGAVLDILEQVVRSRIPCIVEKPLAVTASDRRRLVQIARSSVPVVAPFNRRYQSHTRRACGYLARGVIGGVVDVRVVWIGPFRRRFSPDGGTYRADAAARHGVLFDSGSHALDLVSLLLGDLRAYLEGVDLRWNSAGAEVEVSLELRHQSGARIRLDITDVDQDVTAQQESWACTVTGKAGMLSLNKDGCVVRGHSGETLAPSVDAGELDRPVTDLYRLRDGATSESLGSSLTEVLQLSDVLMAAHNCGEKRRRWARPRGKALGRLNGAC